MQKNLVPEISLVKLEAIVRGLPDPNRVHLSEGQYSSSICLDNDNKPVVGLIAFRKRVAKNYFVWGFTFDGNIIVDY